MRNLSYTLSKKTRAAKKAGFITFLMSVSESVKNVAVEECQRRTTNRGSVAECYRTVKKVDIAKETGISFFWI